MAFHRQFFESPVQQGGHDSVVGGSGDQEGRQA